MQLNLSKINGRVENAMGWGWEGFGQLISPSDSVDRLRRRDDRRHPSVGTLYYDCIFPLQQAQCSAATGWKSSSIRR